MRLARRFPYAGPLPSIPSTGGSIGRLGSGRLRTPLFGNFAGTIYIEPSDFPRSCAFGGCPQTFRCGLPSHLGRANSGSLGSRGIRFRTCTGSLTARGLVASRDIDAPSAAFRLLLQRRHPGRSFFRGETLTSTGRCRSRMHRSQAPAGGSMNELPARLTRMEAAITKVAVTQEEY